MVGSCGGGGGDEYMADRKDLEIYKVTRVQERV
jgi:hypothetical protein